MNILDRLDELEREATAGPWEKPSGIMVKRWAMTANDIQCTRLPDADAALMALSRNHLRALLDVAWAAASHHVNAEAAAEGCLCPDCILHRSVAPLLSEEGGER